MAVTIARSADALEALRRMAQDLPLVTGPQLEAVLGPVAVRHVGQPLAFRTPGEGKRGHVNRTGLLEGVTSAGMTLRVQGGQGTWRTFVAWPDLWAGHVVLTGGPIRQAVAETLLRLRSRAPRAARPA